MENIQRLKVTKSDFNTFADHLDKLFQEGGETRKIMDKAISYPLTLATSDHGETPVMMQTSASKDRFVTKESAEIKKREITLNDADGKPVINLKYAFTEEYYNDPFTGNREMVNVPYVNFEQFVEFLEFTQMLAKTYVECRKYATMLIATKAEFVANRIPGTGYEMYEKLVGSAKMYPITREMLNATVKNGVLEPTQLSISNFEQTKKMALIDNCYLTYKLTNDAKIFNIVANYIKESPIMLERSTVNVEAAPINPIKVAKKDAALTDVNNANEQYTIDKISVLQSFLGDSVNK